MLDKYLLRQSGLGREAYGASATYLMRYPEHITGPQQGGHHRVLRMGVNATSGVSKIEGIPEQRSASGLLQIQFRSAEEYPVCMRRRGRLGERQHENMGRLYAFFLDPGWRDVDLITQGAISKLVGRMTAANSTYPTRIVMPPPVPVTHPR
jgi:hypothetical protein